MACTWVNLQNVEPCLHTQALRTPQSGRFQGIACLGPLGPCVADSPGTSGPGHRHVFPESPGGPRPAKFICSWSCPEALNSLLFLALAGAVAPLLLSLAQVKRTDKLTSLGPGWHLLANASILRLFSVIRIRCPCCVSIHSERHT